jgi:hypothetical protein
MSAETNRVTFKLGTGLEVDTSQIPFFISGSGRCGTTLMRRLILERTESVIPPENYALGLSNRFAAKTASNWEDCCDAIIGELAEQEKAWQTFNLDRQQVVAVLRSVPENYRSIANFWHAFHAVYADSLGKASTTRWGDKTPINAKRIPNVIELFPDARFVFMVRDAFDVAHSYGSMNAKRKGMYLDGARRWAVDNGRLVRVARRRPDQVKVVNYEELVREPDKVTAAVLDFIGLPSKPRAELNDKEARDMMTWAHLRNALGDVNTNSVGKGRASLPDVVKKHIAREVATLQVHFGYEPTGKIL